MTKNLKKKKKKKKKVWPYVQITTGIVHSIHTE